MPKSLFAPTITTETEGSSKPPARDVTVPGGIKIVTPISQLLQLLLPITSKKTPAPRKPPENPLVVGMKEIQNQVRTQNNAEAYGSTRSATLDAFFGLNANSTGESIHEQLAKSWEESPEVTLRIIWNMRSIHEGHNNKIGFYQAFGWLYKYHPRTAIENLRFVTERLCERKIKRKAKGFKNKEEDFEAVESDGEVVEEEATKMPHGYYKDLLNILVLAMRGKLTDPALVNTESLKTPLIRRETRTKKQWKSTKAAKKNQNKQLGAEEAKRRREAKSQQTISEQAQKAKGERKGKYDADHALLKEKLENDKPFLALYAAVAQIFADNLSNDVALLKRIETAPKEEAFDLKFELSSAAKWAPSLDGAHDRPTNIATSIALVMYSKGKLNELSLSIAGEITQEQAQILRGYYRRWIVSPLRRFIDVAEVKMSSQKWSRINYKHVPAECMKKNKISFFKHDEKRLVNYLADVAGGKSSISGATLLPHEILIEALKVAPQLQVPPLGSANSPEFAIQQEIQRRFNETDKKIIEAQWNSLLERMRESGAVESSLGLVDVSGSMGSVECPPQTAQGPVRPIFPAVALGLVLAALAKPPFDNMFITFSNTPELLTVPPGGLADQARWMNRTKWEMNTDYEAVFLKLILPAAVRSKVKPEDMVKRLFVFSDMQFDESVSRSLSDGLTVWETTHDRVVKAFKEAGYEPPEIVYWNLQGGVTKPVLKDTPGTALITGFSANMMKLFMGGERPGDKLVEIGHDGEEVPKKKKDPLVIMERALSKPCYAPLKVFD
ncbi:hypothetical protein B0J17DRAFT_765087 [Rhizoctonia solani]|nr:hypothetical protein B0J17DRAFT_765087 [Rhizoctonia solani]